jgi:hypothetical protein
VAKTGPLRAVNSVRDELLNELREFIRQRNTRPSQRWAFLDRPIVITLLGVVIVGLITARWQLSDKRRELDLEYSRRRIDQQSQVVRSFPAVYLKSASILNHWLLDVLEMAGEQGNCREPWAAEGGPNERAIVKSYSSEILRLQDDFGKTENPEEPLGLVRIEFDSSDVRSSADKMLAQWKGFGQLMQDTNKEYNHHQSLPCQEIVRLNDTRTRMRDALDSHERDLIEAATREIWRSLSVDRGHPLSAKDRVLSFITLGP